MSDLSQAERTEIDRVWGDLPKTHSMGYSSFKDGWSAGRDYYTDPSYCISCGGPCRDESPDPLEQSEERERALRVALVETEKMTALCGGLSWPKALDRLTAINRVAQAALAASQPEVLSERSDTDAAKGVLARLGLSWEPDCSVASALAKLGMEIDLLRRNAATERSDTEPPGAVDAARGHFDREVPNLSAPAEPCQRVSLLVSQDPPSEDAQAVSGAAAILRKLALKRDPRVQEPEPVPLGVRIAAESWLAAYEPSTTLEGESNGN